MWTVGQTVASVSRIATYKGEVTHVAECGRATVRLSNGSQIWERVFEANGRRFPLHVPYARLNAWNAQIEMTYARHARLHAASVARCAANEAGYQEDRALRLGAADYLLELLEGRNSPEAEAAREFVNQFAREVR